MPMYSSRTVLSSWECGGSREFLPEFCFPQLHVIMEKLDEV